MKYAKRKNGEIENGNSQEFVENLLKNLNVELNLPNSISKFLEEIKKNGSTNLIFVYSNSFKKEFKLSETSISFDNHKDLDSFVIKLKEIDPKLKFNWIEEYLFLKSVDRAFWTKHYHILDQIMKLEEKLINSKDDSFKTLIKIEIESLMEDDEHVSCNSKKCPFNSPKRTKSFQQ